MKKSTAKSCDKTHGAERRALPPALGLRSDELARFEPHLSGAHVGEFSAIVSCFSLARERVQSALPGGLALGDPGDIVPSGLHPVLLFVGVQSCVRWHAVPPYFCSVFGMRYREAVVAVPYVQRNQGGNGNHFTAVKLYLDRTLPIYLGWIGALPKERAGFTKRRDDYRIRSPGGAFLLEMTTSDGGIPDRNLQDQPQVVQDHFRELSLLLRFPHLGQYFSAVRSIPLLAAYACCPFHFDLDDVRLRPVKVEGSCARQFCPMLPRDISRPGLDSDSLGSFSMRTSWKIEPPGTCSHP